MAKIVEITDVNELYANMNLGKFSQWIDKQVSEKIVKDILDNKLDYKFIEKSTVNEFCKKYIKQAVDSFLKNNNIDVECMEQVYDEICRDYSESFFGDEIIERVKEELRPSAIFSYDLIDTDDNISDVTDLRNTIDLGNRDGNFIIIGDKLITGHSWTTHSELINKYIEECLNEDINKEIENYRVRDLEKFDGLSDDKSVVFGHIVNNMAFIETCIGYTVNDAVNILKNQGNFKKIYDYNRDNDKVTRLAKKLNNLINLDNENTKQTSSEIKNNYNTDISIEDVVSDIKASGKEYTKIYSFDMSKITRIAQLEKQKMNRLRKFADEQLSLDFDEKINSFDDYLKMYNEKSIADFLLKEYVKLASSDKAIESYIRGYDEPKDRVEVLENLDGCEIFEINDDGIITKLLNKYKTKFGDDYSREEFKDDVSNYIAENLYDDIVDDVMDNITKFLDNKEKEHDTFYYKNLSTIDNLYYLNDSIGEETEIEGGCDHYNRDAAFADIDHQILISNNGESHAQLINKYFNDIGFIELDDDWYRPDVEEIEKKSGAERVAFGHIIGDVWIIEDTTLMNMSVEDVINDIKASGNEYAKIYAFDRSDALRVAKLKK